MEGLTGQLQFMAMTKQNEVLRNATSFNNPYFDTFIQMMLISFSTYFLNYLISNFRFIRLRDFKDFISKYVKCFNKNKIIKLRAKEIKHMMNNRSNWELTDLTQAIFWYLSNNIMTLKGIQQLIEISDTNYYDRFHYDEDEIGNNMKKTFKEATFRINQYDEIDMGNDIKIRLIYSEREEERLIDGKSTKMSNEVCDIEIYSNKRSLFELKEFCNNIHRDYVDFINENSLKDQHIFIYLGKEKSGKKRWRKMPFKTNKSAKSLFIDNRDELLNNIQQFNSPEAKEYYSRIGKPYQLSIMVDGPPGSGKNSLFKVLMKEMFSGDNMRHLIIIPPDTIKDFTDWEEILYDPWIDGFFIPTNKRVYQIDEIEKAFPVLLKNSNDLSKEDAKKHFMKNKTTVTKKPVSTEPTSDVLFDKEEDDDSFFEDETKNKEFIAFYENMKKEEIKKQQKELSKWLNCFDGAIEQEGRVFFMSANNKDKLSDIFTRPGRIDLNINLPYATNEVARDLITYLFNYDGQSSEINKKFDMIEDYKYSQSELYQVCINNTKSINSYSNNYDYINSALEFLLNK